MVDCKGHRAIFHPGRDFGGKIEGAEVDLAIQTHILDRTDRRFSRIRAKRQDAVGFGIGREVSLDLVLHFGRVHAGVDHLAAEFHTDAISIATATLHRLRVGDVVVDAHERGHAGLFGALASTQACLIFRLTDMHHCAELLAFFNGARVHGDHRNAFGDSVFDRAFQHAVIGDGDDDAVNARSRSLLHQTRHISQVAGRRVAVFGGDTHLLAGDLDRILDHVEPAVAVRAVADPDELFALGMGRPSDCRSGKKYAKQGAFHEIFHWYHPPRSGFPLLSRRKPLR
ncbi:MAG: hypothetical protein ACD_10C00046G0001 [uncultured bacterium]|nr:MAG: hypothetical protein ACD_10C00046G0001 [uncultured bacterium]